MQKYKGQKVKKEKKDERYIKLTAAQGYKAMYAFLEEYYVHTGKNIEILADILSELEFFPYQKHPADPANWSTWIDCVNKAKKGKINIIKDLSNEEAERFRKKMNIPDVTPKEYI